MNQPKNSLPKLLLPASLSRMGWPNTELTETTFDFESRAENYSNIKKKLKKIFYEKHNLLAFLKIKLIISGKIGAINYDGTG